MSASQGTAFQVRLSGELGLQAVLGDVAAFHRACDIPILGRPTMPGEDRLKLRDRLLREEVKEYRDAVKAGDIVAVADALADITYIVAGTALEFGIPLDRVWAEVQRSNMAKTGGPRRADGKILKPADWTPPDVAGAIR